MQTAKRPPQIKVHVAVNPSAQALTPGQGLADQIKEHVLKVINEQLKPGGLLYGRSL